MNCIIIKSGTATPRAIKRKDGTQVIFNEQKAAIEKVEDFPVPFTISLGDGQPPSHHFFALCAPPAQARPEHVGRFRRDEDRQRVGKAIQHLLGAIDINL